MQTESESTTSGKRDAIRLSGPADLIAAVPHLVGFLPTESIVLVIMSGARSRVALTVRADLPQIAPPKDLSDFFDPISTAIRSADGDKLVAIFYSNEPRIPRELIQALRVSMAASSVQIVDTLLAGDKSWWHLSEEGTPQGVATKLAAKAVTAGEAALAFEGRAPLPSREALVASFEPFPPSHPCAVGAEDLAKASTLDCRGVLDALVSGNTFDTDQAAQVISSLGHPQIRDQLISIAIDSGLAEPGGLANYLRPVCERLRTLVQAAPTGSVSPVATVLGVLAWQSGEGAVAACALDRALAENDQYRLAVLIERALRSGVPPWLARETFVGAD